MIPILNHTMESFRKIVEKAQLQKVDMVVRARVLTPEEAIGDPDRKDYPILTGEERVMECQVLDARGHAFTDSPMAFEGTIGDVLALPLTTNQNRAIYTATMNAVLGRLGLATATVHCRNQDPEKCAKKLAAQLLDEFGEVEVGLIGLNPALAERLAQTFGPDHLRITDLNEKNMGQRRFEVEVWDGRTRTMELLEASEVIVVTGTTMVNGTFAPIWQYLQATGKSYLVFGVTAAGPGALMGLNRFCPYGQGPFSGPGKPPCG